MLARFGEFAGAFGLPSCASRRAAAWENSRGISTNFLMRLNLLEILFTAWAAIANNFSCSALVPIYPTGLDHLIQDPALFAPAFHFAFGFDPHTAPFKVQGSKFKVKFGSM